MNLTKILVDFYEQMKKLEAEGEKGKMMQLMAMTENDIKKLFIDNKETN